MINLSKDLKRRIIKHSFRDLPKECCGFILENRRELQVFECLNSSASPEIFFSISPQDYAKANLLGKIIAVYHSHPKGGYFSEYDKTNSINHNLPFILYCVKSNSFSFFDSSLSCFSRLLGRKFSLENSNCFTLVKDFFEEELNIKINEYKATEDEIRNNINFFEANYEKEGFLKVDNLDGIRRHDVILMKKKGEKFSSHVAIYLGKDLILHQPLNAFSRVESYSNVHKKLTSFAVRHKSFIYE